VTYPPDVEAWFEESELSICPSCGERRLLPTAGDAPRQCLDCGLLDGIDGAPVERSRSGASFPGGADRSAVAPT